MRALAFAVLLAVAAVLAACSEPIPATKMEYAGDWRSNDMRLLITADGRCEYARKREGGGTTSINAPILRFEGDNIVVGIGMVHTTFVVSRPPALVDGQWRMTVDGVELIRFGALDEVRT